MQLSSANCRAVPKGARSIPRLLFTGGGGAGSEALVRHLCSRYEVFFADADFSAKPYSIVSERWLHIPSGQAAGYVDALIELIHSYKIDLLIPSVDEELLPIAKRLSHFTCQVLLPPLHFVERHLDKLSSNQFLHKARLPAPQTIPAKQGRLDFPCIIKPIRGRGSRNVAAVHSEEELQAQVTISRQPLEDFLVQELLLGDEYTVMMAADVSGKLRAVVPVFVERKRGITLRAMTHQDRDVIEACRLIHKADPVCGCYNIQLIKTTDGSVKPFEINPRISTTTCLGLAAGVDFVEIFLRQGCSSSESDALMDFVDSVKLRRSWYNEFIFNKDG